MDKFDKNLLHKACRVSIMNFIADSNHIQESLNLRDRVNMLEWSSSLDYNTSVSIVFNNGEILDELGIRDFESKFGKFIKYGLAAIAGGIAGSRILMATPVGLAVGAVTYYLFRKFTDPCWQACLRKFGKSAERKVCKYECQVKAAQNIVKDVKNQIAKCGTTKNPLACEKKLNRELTKWSKKLEDKLVHLQQAKATLSAKTGGA